MNNIVKLNLLQMLDLLGASAATLSMILEIIKDNYINQYPEVRIIKNTAHELEYPFEAKNVDYQILNTENVASLHQNLFLGAIRVPTKQIIYEYFFQKYLIDTKDFINLIHSKTAVASTVTLGSGIQINPMCTIAPYSTIGNFVSINRNVSVGHHSTISEFCTLNPGVNIAGHCHIAKGVTIGMGASIIDGKKIGENSIIGAGALVTKDVPDNVVVMGMPAKVTKKL